MKGERLKQAAKPEDSELAATRWEKIKNDLRPRLSCW